MISGEHKNHSGINGLVLAGGKSKRMGFDKGAVDWHGKEQRYFMADLLQPFCNEVFISCREDQVNTIKTGYHVLPDSFTGLGPYGGILSAFKHQPGTAWLVVACDLPLLDADIINYLIANRDISKMATTFISPYDGLPEPLITIWEPESYSALLSFLSQGYTCPRKALINSDVHLLNAPDPDALANVNTPEELDRVKKLLHQKTAGV